jgi:dethiobiotin synthetase
MFPQLVAGLTRNVILVVGLRLGCLNHALLSAQQVQRDGFQLCGWVANRIDPDMPVWQQNLATLERLLPAPLLAIIPWAPTERPAIRWQQLPTS